MKHHIGDRDEQHEKDRQPQHQESELANASLKRVPRPFHGEPMGKSAKLGGAPGAHHEGCGDAADDRGAHADEVRGLPGLLDGRRKILRVLFCRVGFSSEQCLVDEKVASGKQPAIAGDNVAGLQLDHVARNEAIDRDLLDFSVAEHLSHEPHRAAQGIDGVLRPCLLDHVKHNAQQDDADDEREARHLAGPCREPAREQQNDNQGIGETIEKLAPQGAAAME